MNDYSKSWPLPPVSVALTHATNCAQCQSGWLNKSADQGSSGGVSTSGLSDQPTTFRMIVWRTVLAAGSGRSRGGLSPAYLSSLGGRLTPQHVVWTAPNLLGL